VTPAAPEEHSGRLAATLALLVAAVMLYRLATTWVTNDLWGFLAFGRLFWETGRFPYQDVFAYTPTLNPWVYHEWLTGVLFYPLYQWGGGAGLQVLKYVLGLAALFLAYLSARLQRPNASLTFIVFLAISPFITLGYSPVRAQVFTYFFFALTLYVLEGARQRARWRGLLLLPPVMTLWANFHGGFVAGLGLMGIYTLGEALNRQPYRAYGLTLAGSALATLINPYGLEYWIYLHRAITMPRPFVFEWAPLHTSYQVGLIPGLHVALILCLIIFVAALAGVTRWRDYTGWLTVAVTTYMCLKHVRHLMFFLLALGLYGPLLLTRYASRLGPSPWLPGLGSRLKSQIFPLICTGLALFFASLFLQARPLCLVTPDYRDGKGFYPVGAVEYLKKQQLSGKVLTDFNWGQYLLWHLYPAYRVAFDGRYETVYPREVEEAYALFIDGLPGWRNFLEKYPPDLILIARNSRPYPLLKADPGWREIYADPGSVLLARRGFASNLPPAMGQ
jgi:hypothetical protein